MKGLCKFLLTAGFMLFPALVFADTGSNNGALNFAPPPTDYSYLLLSTIFGVVDGVLHGTGSQVMGKMFGVFNAAVLFLAGIVISYTLFTSIMNTAQDGEVMGRSMSSIWIPMRSILGIALLLPKATGYSVIQIMVMWIVVMGVGAADKVWDTVLDYLQGGGVLVISSGAPSQAVVSTLVAPMFKAEICTYGVEAALQKNKVSGTSIPAFGPTIESPATSQAGAYPSTQSNYPPNLKFPGLLWASSGSKYSYQNDYNGFCGNVDIYQNVTGANANNIELARQVAVRQVVLDLSPYAKAMAKFLYSNTNNMTL
jgi:defect-in-organelle-trafficking protein DotA